MTKAEIQTEPKRYGGKLATDYPLFVCPSCTARSPLKGLAKPKVNVPTADIAIYQCPCGVSAVLILDNNHVLLLTHPFYITPEGLLAARV